MGLPAAQTATGGLTPLDVALLLVLIYSCVRGFFQGLISELGLLLALIVGTAVAGRLAPAVGAPLASVGVGPAIRTVVGYIVVLGVIWLAVRIAARVLRRGARLLLLGWVDRLAGAGFGLLRGLLVIVVVGFLIVHFRLDPLLPYAQASPLVRATSFIFPALDALLVAQVGL